MSVGGVDLVGGRVAENGPESAYSVLPIDLLAFGVGSSGVADRHFENSAATFCQFDGQFRLDVEGGTFQRNALEQIRAHHFVTSFHIGEIQVANEVTQ